MKSHGGGPALQPLAQERLRVRTPKGSRPARIFVSQMAEMIMEDETCSTRHPLIVLDGTKCWIFGRPLHRGGARAERDYRRGTIRIAVDVVGALGGARHGVSELLRDYPVWSHRQIRRAVELGLGASGPGEVEVLTADTTGAADFRGACGSGARIRSGAQPRRFKSLPLLSFPR